MAYHPSKGSPYRPRAMHQADTCSGSDCRCRRTSTNRGRPRPPQGHQCRPRSQAAASAIPAAPSPLKRGRPPAPPPPPSPAAARPRRRNAARPRWPAAWPPPPPPRRSERLSPFQISNFEFSIFELSPNPKPLPPTRLTPYSLNQRNHRPHTTTSITAKSPRRKDPPLQRTDDLAPGGARRTGGTGRPPHESLLLLRRC